MLRNYPQVNNSIRSLSKTYDKIKIGSILNEETAIFISANYDIHQLEYDSWEFQLVKFKPDLILIDLSHSNDNIWSHNFEKKSYYKLITLINRCRNYEIPVIFIDSNLHEKKLIDIFHIIAECDYIFTESKKNCILLKEFLGEAKVVQKKYTFAYGTENYLSIAIKWKYIMDEIISKIYDNNSKKVPKVCIIAIIENSDIAEITSKINCINNYGFDSLIFSKQVSSLEKMEQKCYPFSIFDPNSFQKYDYVAFIDPKLDYPSNYLDVLVDSTYSTPSEIYSYKKDVSEVTENWELNVLLTFSLIKPDLLYNIDIANIHTSIDLLTPAMCASKAFYEYYADSDRNTNFDISFLRLSSRYIYDNVSSEERFTRRNFPPKRSAIAFADNTKVTEISIGGPRTIDKSLNNGWIYFYAKADIPNGSVFSIIQYSENGQIVSKDITSNFPIMEVKIKKNTSSFILNIIPTPGVIVFEEIVLGFRKK